MSTSSKRGIITLVIATFFLALMDGVSRYMAEIYDVLNVNMFRFWIIGSFVILVSLRGRGVLASILKTKQQVRDSHANASGFDIQVIQRRTKTHKF